MFAEVRARVPGMGGVMLSTHTHDDLGMAVANTLAGLRGGARQVECTVNGIGERAGNASLEEIVMLIQLRRDALLFATDIRTEELYASSQLLSRLTGVAVQRNKAVVGRNAFAHEAGIHQDGVLKNAITYEIMTPQSVGAPSNHIVLGKHSGRHALSKRYEELGSPLTKPELERAYELFCRLADRKKQVYDEDLFAILDEDSSKNTAFSSAAIASVQSAGSTFAAILPRFSPQPGQPWIGSLRRFSDDVSVVKTGSVGAPRLEGVMPVTRKLPRRA